MAVRRGHVNIEDGLAIDAGAHHLVVLEVASATASAEFDVVNKDFVSIVVGVAETDPNALAGIVAQVNRVQTPVVNAVIGMADIGLLAHAALGIATPNLCEVGSRRVVNGGNHHREAFRIHIVGIVGPEGQGRAIDDVVLLRRVEDGIRIVGTIIVHKRIAHGKTSAAMSMLGIGIAAKIVVAVQPFAAIGIHLNGVPSIEATFKAFGEGVDTSSAAAAAGNFAAFPAAFDTPHGEASVRYVEVAGRIEDFFHHITEFVGHVRLNADTDGVEDGVEAFVIDLDGVGATAEGFKVVVAGAVKGEVLLRVGGLFAFVQVGEAHNGAFRAVGAVEHHVDADKLFAIEARDVHVLVDAARAFVRPHGAAFTRQSQHVVAGIARSRGRANATTSTIDGNVVNPDFVHVIVNMVEGNPHVLALVSAQVNVDFAPVFVAISSAAHAIGLSGTSGTLGTDAPNRSEVGGGGSTSSGGHANLEEVRIGIVGVIVEEVQRSTIAKVVALGRHKIAVGIVFAIIINKGIAHSEASSSMGKIGIIRIIQGFRIHIATRVIVAVHPSATGCVHVDGGPAFKSAFEAEGDIFAFARVVRVVGLVAFIDNAHAPLIDARGCIRPAHVEVSGVGHPSRGQHDGATRVAFVVRTIIVAVGAVDAIVVHGTVGAVGAGATLEDDVRARGADGHGVGLGFHVVRGVVAIGVAGSIGHAVAQPVDGIEVPVTVVALHEDEDVAAAIPSELVFVEHELVPASGRGHASGINLGHASGSGRGGRHLVVGHVGHPDGEALLVVAVLVGGIPADARHRGGRDTSGGQFVGLVEHRADAVFIQGVERHIAKRSAAVANLGFIFAQEVAGAGTAGAVRDLPPNLHEFVVADLNDFGADHRAGIELFLHDEVHLAPSALVRQGERRNVGVRLGVLVAGAVGQSGIVFASQHGVNGVVTVVVGGGAVVDGVAELVGASHGDGDAADRGDAVLFIHIAVDAGFGAVAAHHHDGVVGEGRFAFVIDGGHVEGVARHVVGQFRGRNGPAEVGLGVGVRFGGVEQLAVLVDAIATVGTVHDSVPSQNGGVAFEDLFGRGHEVLRSVEGGGESPDGAAHAVGASRVVELDVPEVVGVVPEVGHRVAVSHVGAEAAVFGIDDGLRVTGFRIVGGTEHEAPTGGILGVRPAQSDAGGLDAVLVVGRIRVEGKARSVDGRARHVGCIDIHGVVGIGRGGNQVVGASLQRQILDDGAGAHVSQGAGAAAATTSGFKFDGDVVNKQIVFVVTSACDSDILRASRESGGLFHIRVEINRNFGAEGECTRIIGRGGITNLIIFRIIRTTSFAIEAQSATVVVSQLGRNEVLRRIVGITEAEATATGIGFSCASVNTS